METATSRIKYAQSLRKCCEYDKAETECRKALEVIEGSAGMDELTKADGFSCLGNILNAKGEYAESIQWHEKALKIRIQKLGEGHPDVTSSRNHIEASTEGRTVNDKLQ